MRLIEAASLQLCSFYDELNVPEYAILSHTWGPTEVSLQEFADSSLEARDTSMKANSGYWKIKKACEQALKQGLDYVWVDTCCIDKTSSAELSEAINSMFRWYRGAGVCYAYLNDVDVHFEAGTDGAPLSNERYSKEELARSRWFKRGWTLQELIAPSNIEFYGRDWQYIGTKSLLRETLQRITGISADVLQTGRVEDESIAKRMSWMASRETTRSEDMAYSLMGIFDVNMPLLYGEGDKAFVRLQEEIMKDSADNSLFTWSPLLSPSHKFWDPKSQLCSVFAEYPIQFKYSGGMTKRRFDEDVAGESYALTNLGVHIKLRLKPCDHPFYGQTWERHYQGKTFVAMLECRYEVGSALEMCRPGIYLVQLSPLRPQYARIVNGGVVPTTTSQEVYKSLTERGAILFTEEDKLQTIYLRKKIPGWAQLPGKEYLSG